MTNTITMNVFDNIAVTRKRQLKEFEKATKMALIQYNMCIDDAQIKLMCSRNLDKSRCAAYGFTHPYPHFIGLTKSSVVDKETGQINLSQAIITLSHESLHLVVIMNESVEASMAMDNGCRSGQSLLQRLQNKGYLGGV